MTLMFCSFEEQPLILRVYGKATVIHRRDPDWGKYQGQLPRHSGARQIFVVDVRGVQTSCGFGLPIYDYRSERGTLSKWSENRVDAGLETYWNERNRVSIDGLPTNIVDDA